MRPAVCLTDPIGPYRHIILAFITSRIPPDLVDSDLVIDMNHEDFSRTGLRLTSTVRLHRVMTVRIGIIKRKLGTLSDTQRTEVGGRLRRMFGF